MIKLEPWVEGDFQLLVRMNAPEMTVHLEGPETQDKLGDRHRRYVAAADSDSVHVYRAVDEQTGISVGQVAFWDREWRGESVYEMGWAVLPEHQGRGFASAAVALAIDLAAAKARRESIHAFPSVDNAASNAVCRKLGFELLGVLDFEYPKGHFAPSNHWRLGLKP